MLSVYIFYLPYSYVDQPHCNQWTKHNLKITKAHMSIGRAFLSARCKDRKKNMSSKPVVAHTQPWNKIRLHFPLLWAWTKSRHKFTLQFLRAFMVNIIFLSVGDLIISANLRWQGFLSLRDVSLSLLFLCSVLSSSLSFLVVVSEGFPMIELFRYHIVLYMWLFLRWFYFRKFRESDPRENFHFNWCLFIVIKISEKSQN